MPRGNPSPQMPSKSWLQRAGLFGTYLFASFALLGITPATVGLVLLTLAFIIGFTDWRTLGRDPVAVTAFAFALYAAIHSVAAYLTAPVDSLAEAAVDAGSDWVKILLFIPFAYWAGGSPERVRLLLLSALMGFVLGTLRKIDWAGFDATFFYARFESYLPAIAFGMFTGLGALGLIALRDHFWHPGPRVVPRWLRVTGWLLLLALMLEGLMLSYSRASWMSFAAGTAFLFFLEWRSHRSAAPAPKPSRRIPIAAAAITVAALVVLYSGQIGERLQEETETIDRILAGDFDAIPSSSAGLRAHALRFAADLWSQRPWLGWGAGSSRYLLIHSERPELMQGEDWLGHLHNTYMEILVQLGIFGFALATALIWSLTRGCTQTCRNGPMPGDLCRYFAVALLFALIWNLTSYRLLRHDYTFFWIVFAGSAYSFRLRALLQDGREHTVDTHNQEAR